ncbi:MAG: pyruvate dehydrogenase complex dihydrolipoamide acetyltransferase [Alphaproteobacteria bacterium]|nr:pyruvate dehydrogenase complex dihydrolipoamide acetyltransferase [Alphaproteobacteria bacterium]
MPIEIRMPALSPTMSEGNLARWLKKEGDVVAAGDAVAEIETDKATMELESADEGRLGRIVVPDGSQGVKVGALIGMLLEEGEDDSALGSARPAVPTPATAPARAPIAVQAEATVVAKNGNRVFASPLARRMAAEAGLDVARMQGSGPHGRVVKADVERARAAPPPSAPQPAPAAAKAPAPAPVPGFGPAYEEIPLSSMRKVIARRLTEASQTIPHFYLTIDCLIDRLLEVRGELNGRAEGAFKLSVNDFVIRAVALALRKVPDANASFTETAIRRYTEVDVSMAVATPNGLITPVIRGADRKGLASISNEAKALVDKARQGKLKPEEYQGGGFTVSNLGMFGIKQFEAIINPPQGCILAIGAGEQRPVVKAGALAIATVMTCTLSVDHRVVDGAVGAQFLTAFKGLIEDPLSMLL